MPQRSPAAVRARRVRRLTGSRPSMAAAISTSSCSAIRSAKRNAATSRCSALPLRSACRSSRPTASATLRKKTASCSISSPPSATTPHLTMRAACSRRTPCGICARRVKWPRSSTTFPRPSPTRASSAERLEFTLDNLGYEFPHYPVPEGETMDSFLAERVEEGVCKRYGSPAKRHLLLKARAQVRHELALISKLGFAGYFLIVWDLIRYCQRQGFLVQGRGSAANSAVCYALEITAVDPVGMELLFERFLSENRGEWPDIDLDLPSGDQREQVIQYIYERYGALGAAMTANVITYRGRSAAREVGKALGFEEEQIARLSSLMGHWEWRGPNDTLGPPLCAGRLRHPPSAHRPLSRSLPAPQGSSAPSRPALGRHGHLRRAAQSRRPHRARLHARPHRRAVGQGRLRRSRPHQSGPARPGHDGRAQRLHRIDPPPLRKTS